MVFSLKGLKGSVHCNPLHVAEHKEVRMGARPKGGILAICSMKICIDPSSDLVSEPEICYRKERDEHRHCWFLTSTSTAQPIDPVSVQLPCKSDQVTPSLHKQEKDPVKNLEDNSKEVMDKIYQN